MTPAERQEWERLVVAFGNAEFDCAHWNAEFDCAHWNDELYPHPYAHYLEAARSAKAALTAFVERLTAGECEWKYDHDGFYGTSCKKAWFFEDGGPEENNARFCPFCGDRIRVSRVEEVAMDRYCQHCGSEPALNVESVRVYEGADGQLLDLCEFCRAIPGGIMRHGEGVAYSIVGNILARLIKEAK